MSDRAAVAAEGILVPCPGPKSWTRVRVDGQPIHFEFRPDDCVGRLDHRDEKKGLQSHVLLLSHGGVVVVDLPLQQAGVARKPGHEPAVNWLNGESQPLSQLHARISRAPRLAGTLALKKIWQALTGKRLQPRPAIGASVPADLL